MTPREIAEQAFATGGPVTPGRLHGERAVLRSMRELAKAGIGQSLPGALEAQALLVEMMEAALSGK